MSNLSPSTKRELIFQIILGAAKRGDKAPSNRVLGEAVGTGAEGARSHIVALQAKGRIYIATMRGGSRQIAIPGTPYKTAWKMNSASDVVRAEQVTISLSAFDAALRKHGRFEDDPAAFKPDRRRLPMRPETQLVRGIDHYV